MDATSSFSDSSTQNQSKYDAMIPCWIITLHPASERVLSLQSQLHTLGLETKVLNAVDGRHGLPALFGKEKLSPVDTLIRHYRLLNGAEVGCYLSHLRAIEQAWSSGLDRVCILEDDIGLEDDFPLILQAICKLPETFELVRLMALRQRRRKVVGPLAPELEHVLVRPLRGQVGTQGYVINRAGMKKVLESAYMIRDPIDIYFDNFWEHGIRVFGIEPHIIYEHAHTSSIQSSYIHRPHIPALLYMHSRVSRLHAKLRRLFYILMRANEFYPSTLPEKDSHNRPPRLK